MRHMVFAALACSCVFGAACAAEDAVRAEVSYDPIGHGTYVILTNSSKQAVCVNDDLWRSDDPYMSLFDKKGGEISKFTFTEIRPNVINGLDVSRPYRILPQGTKHQYSLDEKVFDTPPGMYQVRVRVLYYFCDDLPPALQNRKVVAAHEIVVSGEMETFGRFWKGEHR